jgi:hypothetical protein
MTRDAGGRFYDLLMVPQPETIGKKVPNFSAGKIIGF